MKKLKNLCLAALIAYALVQTNQAYGSQRFMNFARYATPPSLSTFAKATELWRDCGRLSLSRTIATCAAATRCSQVFQTIKQEKIKLFQKEPVKWTMNNKAVLLGAGLATGLALNAPVCHSEEIETAEAPASIEIRTRLEALFASQGITIKINPLLKDPGTVTGWYTETLIDIKRFEKEENVNVDSLVSFLCANHFMFSDLDHNNIARVLLNVCDKTIGRYSIHTLLRALLDDKDKVYFIKQLIEKEALTSASGYEIKDIFDDLPQEQRTPLALLFFEKSFETLDSFTIECLIPFLKKLPLEDRVDCINRLIENGKLQQQYSDQIEQTFNLLEPAQQIPLVSLFLEKSLDVVSMSTIEMLLKKLSLEDQITWIKRFIENGRLQKEAYYIITDIFTLLPSPERAPLICLLLETSLDTLRSRSVEILLEKLLLEDRIKCIKQLLENGKLKSKHFREMNTIFYTLPEEQRSSLTLLFLEKYFDALNEYDIRKAINNVLHKDRVSFIKQLIETRKLETKSFEITHALFSSLPSIENIAELALLFLKKSFDALDESFNASLILKLSLNKKLLFNAKIYTEKLIKTKKIDLLYPEIINELFKSFSDEERSELASLFLKKSCTSLLESGSLRALPILINQLSSETEKVDYLHRVIESRKIETFDADQIQAMLEPLSSEARSHWALLFLEESYGDLHDSTIKNLIQYCPEGLKQFWFEEFAKKNNLLNSFISELTQGPLFSFEFIMKHYAQIMSTFNEAEAKKAETLIKKASIFAAKEYAKGNIVLFHGQHDQWAFFEKIFKALLKIKYNRPTPKNYAWVRFIEQALLSDEEVAEIRKDGVTYQTSQKYRPKVLFTNLHLLANDSASNSLQYVLSNSDQSATKQLHPTLIKNLFVELGMEEEYEQIQKEDPTLFKRLYDLYKKDVLARGNVGRLLCISLTKEVASELCYSTTSGAPLEPHSIDGKKTTDITEIAAKYEQVSFDNEHALILASLITNPEKAADAGVVIETITSEPTEESKKYAEELDAEIARPMTHVQDMYYARILREALNPPSPKAMA